MVYIGFHGTDANNVASIERNNFRLSKRSDDWLGEGVYFFIEGISCPRRNAKDWGKNSAYKKGVGLIYVNYSVIQVQIILENHEKVFDATTSEGLKVFNVLREAIIKKHDEYFKKDRSFYENDRIIWDIISEQSGLEAIIHNVYIKNKIQRMKKIGSIVPNSTVLCVKNNSLIDIDSMKVVSTGSVDQ